MACDFILLARSKLSDKPRPRPAPNQMADGAGEHHGSCSALERPMHSVAILQIVSGLQLLMAEKITCVKGK